MPHRRLRTGRDPCGEHKPEETGHCSNQDDVATSSRCGAIVEIPSPVDSHGSSRNSTLCCWISLLEHTTSCNRFWRGATGRRVGRRMGTPVRTFQMGDTSTLGWSALRSYKCRHWQDQGREGIARLDITCVTHRMLYRSYHNKNSRVLISNLLRAAATEPIVPDIAFSLPPSELPAPAGVRSISQGRPIVAISPIVFCKPQSWPSHDRLLFDNYLREMAKVISQLIRKGYFIVVVWSSLGDDNTILPELLRQLDPESRGKLSEQAYFPAIATWRDLVAVLEDADYLIASRLHSVILGCLAQVPTVAISFDSKVDWVMADLGQTEYLLHIRDLKAEQVLAALAHLKDDRTSGVSEDCRLPASNTPYCCSAV